MPDFFGYFLLDEFYFFSQFKTICIQQEKRITSGNELDIPVNTFHMRVTLKASIFLSE